MRSWWHLFGTCIAVCDLKTFLDIVEEKEMHSNPGRQASIDGGGHLVWLTLNVTRAPAACKTRVKLFKAVFQKETAFGALGHHI